LELHAGQIEVTETFGGQRGLVATRRFLMSPEAYSGRRHGFMIDLARHVEIHAA
jgi:hypothetical protein